MFGETFQVEVGGVEKALTVPKFDVNEVFKFEFECCCW